MATLKGGYPIYGQEVGIIMLDCAFPRPPGDIGNARSFPFPVRYEVLEGIPACHLIRQEEPAAVAALVKAAQRLERLGVRSILTSCGLFLRYQARLAAAVSVPVATSPLVLLPFLLALLPSTRKVGVVTADAKLLMPVLDEMGWIREPRVALEGMEECPVFCRTILEPVPPFELDPPALQGELIRVVGQLLEREPAVGILLLECTNLSPYSRALREAFGYPVFDVIELAHLLFRTGCRDDPFNRGMWC